MKPVDNELLSSLGLSANKDARRSNDRLGQDQFLELMVAQLKNQDPMKPMDNGDFLGQIAQFSTVSGIQDLQSSFNQLATSLTSSQALQASALVGRTVLVQAPANESGRVEVALPQNGVVAGAIEVPVSTDYMVLNVFDQNGRLVRSIQQNGVVEAGMMNFVWDGLDNNGQPLPPGTYQIGATVGSGSQAQAVEVYLADAVTSVTLGRAGEGVTLNLAGLGAVGMSDVKQIM